MGEAGAGKGIMEVRQVVVCWEGDVGGGVNSRTGKEKS